MSGLADAEMHTSCKQYLTKRPFQGRVPVFEDKAKVKEMCRGPGEMGWKAVHWDGKLKLWGTMNMASVPKLLASGKWEPVGIQRHWYGCLSHMAKAKSVVEESDNAEKRERSTAAVKDKSVQDERERISALEERKRRFAAQEERNKVKSMLDPSDEEIKEVAGLGFDDGVSAFALRLEAAFGPVAGMSPEGRVLRWLGFKLSEARAKAYSDTGAKWMTPDDLAPYYHAARDSWVRQLNAAAKRGDGKFDDPLTSKRTSKGALKRGRYDDPDTGGVADTSRRSEVDCVVAGEVSKETVKVQPSCANYGAYCATCGGMISAQFRECMCGADWVPCHGCSAFVARHQKCKFDHPAAHLWAAE